jgi:6-pyruvoyltetrahydropterin/6-carboxytetrahydropterin synthase
MSWVIDKQIEFCYGHRVWSQQLSAEFCETGDTFCKCKHLHGHQGKVHVFLESYILERGMVTDFKHLGWLKNFLDDHLDHKFIVDINDPWVAGIINAYPVTEPPPAGSHWLTALQPVIGLNTSDEELLKVIPVLVPDTDHLAGYEIDVSQLSGPEQEFYEGFFIVNFTPTSEHLCKWVYDLAAVKMARLGVKVSRVDWWETPKSRSSYSGV